MTIEGRRSIRVTAQWIHAWLERHARGAEHAGTSERRSTEVAHHKPHNTGAAMRRCVWASSDWGNAADVHDARGPTGARTVGTTSSSGRADNTAPRSTMCWTGTSVAGPTRLKEVEKLYDVVKDGDVRPGINVDTATARRTGTSKVYVSPKTGRPL